MKTTAQTRLTSRSRAGTLFVNNCSDKLFRRKVSHLWPKTADFESPKKSRSITIYKAFFSHDSPPIDLHNNPHFAHSAPGSAVQGCPKLQHLAAQLFRTPIVKEHPLPEPSRTLSLRWPAGLFYTHVHLLSRVGAKVFFRTCNCARYNRRRQRLPTPIASRPRANGGHTIPPTALAMPPMKTR